MAVVQTNVTGTHPIDTAKLIGNVSTPFTEKTRVYILYYHHRASAPLTRIFCIDGDLFKAAERGKEHCRRCNYRFIKVRPFVVDLEEIEKRINDGLSED